MTNKNKERKTGKLELECLEGRVMLSGIYDHPITSGVKFAYFNESGEKVTGVLRGPGAGSWELDAQKDLYVELRGTTDRSSFVLTGKDADIEQIDVTGSLRILNGKYADVEANGEVNVSGGITMLNLENVSGDVGIGGNVKTMKIASANGAEISAKGIEKILVRYHVSGTVIESAEDVKRMNVGYNFADSKLFVNYDSKTGELLGNYISPFCANVKGNFRNSFLVIGGANKTIKFGSVKTDNNDADFGVFHRDGYAVGTVNIGRVKYTFDKRVDDFLIAPISKLPLRPEPEPPPF